MTYQDNFNNTLSKLRMVLEVTQNERLMRSVAKIMFDFSDNLKRDNLLKDEEPNNGMDKNTNIANNQ